MAHPLADEVLELNRAIRAVFRQAEALTAAWRTAGARPLPQAVRNDPDKFRIYIEEGDKHVKIGGTLVHLLEAVQTLVEQHSKLMSYVTETDANSSTSN